MINLGFSASFDVCFTIPLVQVMMQFMQKKQKSEPTDYAAKSISTFEPAVTIKTRRSGFVLQELPDFFVEKNMRTGRWVLPRAANEEQ